MNINVKMHVNKCPSREHFSKIKKSGFTLIELLAVIIILGILMIIAIPSVTNYISDSRKSAYITTAKAYIDSIRNDINSGKISAYEKDVTYYVPGSCATLESGGDSPYGKFIDYYVVVTYNGDGYDYYWTSRDDANMGIYLTYSDLLDEEKIETSVKMIKTDIGVGNRSRIKLLNGNSCSVDDAEEKTANTNIGEREYADETINEELTLYNTVKKDAMNNKGAILYTGNGSNSFKNNVYYYNGNANTTNNNVILGNICWKIVRTTDTGGVKAIYNGYSKQIIENNIIKKEGYSNVINDTKYPYTYDGSTNTWENTNNNKGRTTTTITFSILEPGDYALNYDISVLNSDFYSDYVYIYKDGVEIKKYSGDRTGNIDLGKINPTNKITVKYDRPGDYSGSMNKVKFSVGLKTGKTIIGCANKNLETTIGTTSFNNNFNSQSYIGYMYNETAANKYTRKSLTVENSYLFGNSFTYENGKYKLKNDSSKEISDIKTDYKELNNKHYTCFNSTGECEKISYVYYYNGSKNIEYIELDDGKSVEDALDEMLWDENVNEKNSIVKDLIDTWYQNNMTQYTDKLEDTIFCNDRSIFDMAGWDPDGGDSRNYMKFGARGRDENNADLTCKNKNDSFTVSKSNGNGKLKYPVGLLTKDEAVLIGNSQRSSGVCHWLGSANYYDSYYDAGMYVGCSYISTSIAYFSSNVRPVVSFKPGTMYSSGDGTVENPYIIK